MHAVNNSILITGSSGMLGTSLFKRLLASGYSVTGVDKRNNRWSSEVDHNTIHADLAQPKNLRSLPREIDLLIHFASNVRVYKSILEPDLALENIITTYNILNYAKKNQINRVIFASSREVYGEALENNGYEENMLNILSCPNPYAASKISSESLLYAFSRNYGIIFVIFRFSNIYGKFDDSDRVIPLWINQTLNNQPITVYGKEKELDFTYIDDATDVVLTAIEQFERVQSNVFNIASGKTTKLTTIAEKIRDLLKSNTEILIKENRSGEILKSKVNISKANHFLHYHPKIGIDEGLKRTTQWYKQLYDKEKKRNRYSRN